MRSMWDSILKPMIIGLLGFALCFVYIYLMSALPNGFIILFVVPVLLFVSWIMGSMILMEFKK